ncbi:MAG: S24/S26 family peptidase [Alistipes sp.]|nr:S24/S26 family peptidase [Alistipes sp.]
MQRLILPNHVLLPEVEQMLSEGMSVTLKVKGNSMLPFIVGDRDSVVLVRSEHWRRDDVVLARPNGDRYVLHRILRIHGDEVTLRGDGNLREWEQCRRSDLCGKVIRIERNGRSVDTDSLSERCCVRLWQLLYPLRRYLLAAYRRMNHLR